MTNNTTDTSNARAVSSGLTPFDALAEQEIKAASKRAALLTLGGAILVLGSLIYGGLSLRDVQTRKEQLEHEVTEQSKQLASITETKTRLETDINSKNIEISRLTKQETDLQQSITIWQRRVEELQSQLKDTEEKLGELTSQLRESASFTQYIHKVNLGTAKYLINQSPALGALLSEILKFQENGLSFGFGNTPDDGFTSPGFADYLLRRVSERYRLRYQGLANLESANSPDIGDICVYEGGLTMFYLRDERRAPFVIGMTTVGILSLEPNFGVERIRVLRTGLSTRPR
jgi:hypothetical protein